MRFKDIRGNEDVKRALVNMADTGRVAHAMLFFGLWCLSSHHCLYPVPELPSQA